MKLLKYLLSTALLASTMTSSAATDPNKYAALVAEEINDLPLIYIGSNHRSKWDKEILKPYVVHTYPDGHSSWMFDGFLMVEFVLYSKDGAQSFAIDGGWPYGEPARKEHWEYMLEHQLGLATNTGCKAIDDLISEYLPILGAPSHRHQVVMSLPVPTMATQVWGEINGRKMNFENIHDRIFAINWYIDLIMEKWKDADFKNLDLAGVYWTQEAPEYGSGTGQMATEVNEYAHSLGLKTYWIPYYKVKDRDKWREMNFDIAYTQPSYAFNTDVPISQLEDAVNSSFDLGLGVEMEFEGYNFTNVNGSLIKTPAYSCGLYDVSPTFWNRVKDYIDIFETLGAFEMMPIAYYAGYQAFYDYETSGNPKDKELMDRIAKLMEERHIVTEWYTPNAAGIEDAELHDSDIAYGGKGYIYISNDAGDSVEAYAIDGRKISGNAETEGLNYGYTIACQPGIYVVKSEKKSVKVIVR